MMSRVALVALCFCLLTCPAPIRAEYESPIAVTNAKIIAVVGNVIDNGTIVIDKGRIVAVGQNIAIPVDSEIVDATGLIVYPGFIDAATHAGISRAEPSDEERALREDENPDVVEGPQSATVKAYRRLMHPHWRAEEMYDPRTASGGDFRRNGFTAALIAPKPAIFSGSSAVVLLGDEPPRRSILATDVAQHAAFVTSDQPRRPRGPRITPGAFDRPQYPSTMIGSIAAFRQIMLDAVHHADLLDWHARHRTEVPPPVDRDLDVLARLQKERGRIAFIANTENEIHRALDAAEQFKLRPVILGGRAAWKAAKRLKESGVPVIVSLKWSKEPEAPKPDKPEGDAPAPHALDPVFDAKWEKGPFEPQRLFDERVRLWEEEVDNARMLHEAGVTIAIGTFEMKSPDDFLKNLRKAIARGLPEDVALSALTENAAEILGVADRLGGVAPTKLANLTIFDKPFADEKAKVKWAFVQGKRFDPAVESKRPDRRDPGRGRGGRKPEDEEMLDRGGATAASQPTTDSQPTTAAAPPRPDYEVELESDRKPFIDTGGDLLLRNATVLTVTKGVLEETDVMIQDGRISAVGRGLTAPPGMTAIDLRGYFVMPGIIDCHSHICIDGGLNEFSLSVTPEVRIGDAVDHESVAAYRALAGGVTCIHTMHGSANTIGGQNVVLRLKYGKPAAEWRFTEAPRSVKFALGENVKQSNFGRRGTRFPNSRMGVEATIRRSFDAALRYKREWEAFERDKAEGKDPRPPRRDLRLEALAAVLDGGIWVHSHCYRADEILRLLAVAEEYGFRVAVLQHILEGYRIIPEMRRHGVTASTFSDWWAYKLEAYDAIPHNAARMTQGGVVATVNSDSPELMRHLNLEAAKSLRFGGLSPEDCLRLITINGAIQLGVDKYVGSIEPGKRADIAVFDGHPLDTFSRCVLTVLDGEVYFKHPELDVARPIPGRAAKTFPGARDPLAVLPSARGEYWIIGATVHPVSGPVIEKGLVVIADGKIARVGPTENVAIPDGAARIDATGLHVFPGLINAHATLGLTEIGSVAGSVDTADIGDFQADLLAQCAFNPFASAVEVARCEGVTSAMLVPGGGMIAGQTGLVHLDGWSMPEALVATSLGLVVNLPSLPVEFPEDLEEEQKQEQLDAHRTRLARLEEFLRSAQQYVRRIESNNAPRRGDEDYDARLEAMSAYVMGRRPVLFRADSYKQIVEALRFADRYKLRPVILGGRHAWKLASRLADERVDVILGRTTDLPGDKFEPWDSVYRNPETLARAGVRFAITVPDASLTKLLGVEAGYASAYGLDPEHALRSITLDAARIIGVDDRLGSLEVGKSADVIVCTDTPLQAGNCVVAAFIAGRPIELTSKHTRDDVKWRSRPEPALTPAPAELRGPAAQRIAPRG